MTVIRMGLMASSLLWVLALIDRDPFIPYPLVIPAVAIACYLVYLVYGLATRKTLWLETVLLGLALLPLVAGMALAGLAATWGGIQWVRQRGRVDSPTGSKAS